MIHSESCKPSPSKSLELQLQCIVFLGAIVSHSIHGILPKLHSDQGVALGKEIFLAVFCFTFPVVTVIVISLDEEWK